MELPAFGRSVLGSRIVLAVDADWLFKATNGTRVHSVRAIVHGRKGRVGVRNGGLGSLVVDVLLEEINDRVDRERLIGHFSGVDDHVFKRLKVRR